MRAEYSRSRARTCSVNTFSNRRIRTHGHERESDAGTGPIYLSMRAEYSQSRARTYARARADSLSLESRFARRCSGDARVASSVHS